jgi:hypothetical protein
MVLPIVLRELSAPRQIEEDFFIGPETMQEVERSHQEVLRGEAVSLEDLKERLGMKLPYASSTYGNR